MSQFGTVTIPKGKRKYIVNVIAEKKRLIASEEELEKLLIKETQVRDVIKRRKAKIRRLLLL